MLNSVGPSGKDNNSAPIRYLRRVTSSTDSSILLESGSELAQFLSSSSSSDSIIMIGDNRDLVSFLISNGGLDRDDLVLEVSGLLSSIGFLVGISSELVQIGSLQAVLHGDLLRGVSHGHQTVPGDFVVEKLLGKLLGVDHAVHVEVTHAFYTSSDSAVDNSRFDLGSDDSAGLDAAGALSVDRHSAGLDRKT